MDGDPANALSGNTPVIFEIGAAKTETRSTNVHNSISGFSASTQLKDFSFIRQETNSTNSERIVDKSGNNVSIHKHTLFNI